MGLELPGRGWKHGHMAYTPDQLAAIGRAVQAARIERGWGKEEAGRAAGISSITWKRIEDGLRVHDTKLRATEASLRWASGSFARVAQGQDPIPAPRGGPSDPAPADEAALLETFHYTTEFARLCEDRGADPDLCRQFISDAAILMSDAVRAIQSADRR